MKKLSDFPPKKQSEYVKNEFFILLEEIIEEKEQSVVCQKLNLEPKQLRDLMDDILKFKNDGCACGSCINKVNFILSDKYDDIISIAVEKAEARKYE